MTDFEKLKTLGFSQYEITCYLVLAVNHPINGSQLSKLSGIARSRVYDVLRSLMRKGYVLEVAEGLYVPLPANEMIKRLRLEFDKSLDHLKGLLEGISFDASTEFIWTIRGVDHVMAKAREMIAASHHEIYARLFPEAGSQLAPDMEKAKRERGVRIHYISMGPSPVPFEIQVTHPGGLELEGKIGGRSFDIISDKSEALVGIFESGQENSSPITWSRNRLFVIANRDSLKHDFYHYFLDKIHEKGLTLDENEKKIYALLKAED
jgi:sugar-specific transcriptional regulator TrmB